ncbi:vacuolar endopolyphosphatase, putative [Talaromyces stipitatus ATCC 10500]|uniref:Endopolyphosphatase n=1 Tax=Talaromyces stipitatus (strain ATCC 10500 / CBS 375.48 / QM 6759 / NRRL 1006) TaxID=441959 RepID=B8LVR2_TALSN|nr:vacuolar endopolyphosphatase, putative [Talaromyces stipitatus ATCC 10500]EED24192.1 vacuolar endopolyphosphatase, putative [Talaromyces stipitatus ATCC 10500]
MQLTLQRLLVAAVAAAIAATASPLAAFEQQRLNAELQRPELSVVGQTISRKLTGKFLHITDLHLDRFYVPGSNTEDEACHHGKGNAGYLGAPGSECDSPELLINQTFEWIDKNLRDKVDFVIWTGDSARHDNDERIPRTENQIEEFNAAISNKFIEVFSHRSDHPNEALIIPIIPNIGNNDIMPHNIFEKGPNRWTEKLAHLWESFIPEEQRHTFVEGGYFHTEVIPNRLAVFSLNTLYFFDSNQAVDGCAQKSEPGYHQMEWLRVQLQLLRERGMKAILMGHVPPARSADKQAWDESCWQKYTLWLRQYRDVVVGGLYGHMNIDHFMLQDSDDVDMDSLLREERMPPFVTENNYENFTIESKGSYLSSLRDLWAELPTPPQSVLEDEWSISDADDDVDATKKKKNKSDKKKEKEKKKKFFKEIGGEYAERFSLTLVSPSVVPNYYPSLRVIEYDITGMEKVPTWAETQHKTGKKEQQWANHELEVQKKSKKTPIPDPPSKRTPPGPAYSRQPLSLLNIVQYYANITQEDNTNEVATKEGGEEGISSKNFRVNYQLEYHTGEDDVYKLRDFTVRSIYNLATRIGAGDSPSSLSDATSTATEDENDSTSTSKKNKKKKKNRPNKNNKTWKAFVERAFVGFHDYDEIEDKL